MAAHYQVTINPVAGTPMSVCERRLTLAAALCLVTEGNA